MIIIAHEKFSGEPANEQDKKSAHTHTDHFAHEFDSFEQCLRWNRSCCQFSASAPTNLTTACAKIRL